MHEKNRCTFRRRSITTRGFPFFPEETRLGDPVASPRPSTPVLVLVVHELPAYSVLTKSNYAASRFHRSIPVLGRSIRCVYAMCRGTLCVSSGGKVRSASSVRSRACRRPVSPVDSRARRWVCPMSDWSVGLDNISAGPDRKRWRKIDRASTLIAADVCEFTSTASS